MDGETGIVESRAAPGGGDARVACGRHRCGELVQWYTSVHDWLEGRGETVYLISMIDDATSRWFARFVRHDSTSKNMGLLWDYLQRFGRLLAFCTDKAGMFQVASRPTRRAAGRTGSA